MEEIERIEALELQKGTSIWHTHKVWLVAFYFAGIRISDIVKLKWSDFKDNRLFYMMSKNQKPLSSKIPDKAAAILEFYKEDTIQNRGYAFPYLRDAKYNDPEDILGKQETLPRYLTSF